MKIVIIGDGKVGHRLTRQLSEEDYDVVLIDQNEGKLQEAVNRLDILCITGDGADAEVQKEAGVPEADLVIACASTDELNMFSCLLARKLGARHTIARVRNPVYFRQIGLLKEDLRLSMAVNPELTVAEEISRILIYPDTAKVETFMKGKADLLEFIVRERSHLDGLSLAEIYQKFKVRVLVCAVRRGNEVFIPDGDFVVHYGDRLHIVAAHRYMKDFFQFIEKKRPLRKGKRVLICGGGRVGYYLARRLLELGMLVKIIEKDPVKCEDLCQALPRATVIHGNASDQELLTEEGIDEADALVALTGVDEENIILTLYAKSRGVDKVVAKVNEDSRAQLGEELGIDGIVAAKEATADAIMSYVRARQNSYQSSNVESMYELVDDKVEALEFYIREDTDYTYVPLKDLPVKKNNLIACIGRKRDIIIPGGEDMIKPGDSVIVVTTRKKVQNIEDILERRE
ncbi:MAG TPA: Trk system potassium transporter TrkA [Candidatus Bariatricus faecipullorum]|nr:Trk system potassium transporter TrkA [Candidatus Bariatricus faecipullorum]